MFKRRTISNVWEGAMEPIRIIKNVYFVGTYQASAHLIDTGDGLILIDVGYSDSLYLLINSIYKAGFKPEDIKYILLSHWHGDHTQGTRALCELTGAKTFIGEPDAEKAKQFFEPDVLLRDGDVVSLGNTAIRCVATPGHTRGTISFFFDAVDNDRKYKVGMFGGAGANTLKKGHFDYEGCREDYLKSINILRKEKVDVFIGNHTWNNDTQKKGDILLKTGENQFIDSELWYTFLDFCEERLHKTEQEK